MGLIKYKTLKPAAYAARTPQVLDRDFNYAEVLIQICLVYFSIARSDCWDLIKNLNGVMQL